MQLVEKFPEKELVDLPRNGKLPACLASHEHQSSLLPIPTTPAQLFEASFQAQRHLYVSADTNPTRSSSDKTLRSNQRSTWRLRVLSSRMLPSLPPAPNTFVPWKENILANFLLATGVNANLSSSHPSLPAEPYSSASNGVRS